MYNEQFLKFYTELWADISYKEMNWQINNRSLLTGIKTSP